MTPRSSSPLVAGAVALLVACGVADCGKQPSKSKGKGADRVVIRLGGQPFSVRVVHPGKEPKRALSYTPASARRKVRIKWKLEQPHMCDGNMRLEMTLAWRTGRRSADGSSRHRFDLLEATGDASGKATVAEAEVMKQIYAKFAEIAGHVAGDRQGAHTFTQTRGWRSRPSVPWLLRALAVPLPEQPVGVGARWEATGIDPRAGFTGNERRQYRVLAMTDTTVKVSVSGTRSWKRKGKPSAGVTFTGGSEKSSGVLSFALADPLPTSVRLTLAGSQWVKVRHPKGKPAPSGVGSEKMDYQVEVRLGNL